MNNSIKKILLGVVAVVVVFGLVFAIVHISNDDGLLSYEEGVKLLNKNYTKLEKINDKIQTNNSPIEGSYNVDDPTIEKLPSIDNYPLVVEGKKKLNIEIFSATEKAGPDKEETKMDRFMVEIAQKFNKENIVINGEEGSISLRSIASGAAADYIMEGISLPDGWTPSNELWEPMVSSKSNLKISLIEKRLVGNVTGIVMKKEKYKEFISKYGELNTKTIIEAVTAGELKFGYTNPFPSSTGLNFILDTLYHFDNKNILSSKAKESFEKFQKSEPFTAYSTIQMREKVESGSLDAMVLEYQSFVNTKESEKYEFVPFGVRHDGPMYAIGELSEDKAELLKRFTEYCLSEESQKIAKKYGFNQYDDYKSSYTDISGKEIFEAQKLWKQNKDGGRPVISVFVADTSGSMNQVDSKTGSSRMQKLKESLLVSSAYINEENYIGLVNYSTNVRISLGIDRFSESQKSKFIGEVKALQPGGSTATSDGIIVGLKMLLEAKEQVPNAKLQLFILSDGDEMGNKISTNVVKEIIQGLEIQVNTIAYGEEGSDEFQKYSGKLKEFSEINESIHINAKVDGIVYEIKSLLNAQM